ncbi:hypothetical protein AMST5_03200 [freshwater sediment metagenome]|jgi:putative transcriptional regulator|uniref:Uncharacterized protein n=1 Tax=freshwater sediment metagenome TaxID=556182 RepID=A0AA48REF3_9ZZZZ
MSAVHRKQEAAGPNRFEGGDGRRFLDGQLLVAMPTMADERFARSVIYLCAHSEEGAMGIVVNQPARVKNFPDLLVQLQVIAPQERISLPRGAEEIQVLSGGPVQTDRGFVLHTPDFFIDNSTLPIDDGVSLTATVDILRAIAAGEGPNRAVLALGYAGWDAGQLEDEILRNGWLHCPADPSLLFDRDLSSKYTRALRSMGVDLERLSATAGHA